MATLYVSPLGSNTSPYDTWAKAANQLAIAVAYCNSNNPGGTPHKIYVAPGAYSGNVFISGTWPNNMEVIGCGVHGSTDIAPAWSELISVFATTSYAIGFNTNTSGIKIYNIALIGGAGSTQDALYVQGTGHQFFGVKVRDVGGRISYINAATNILFDRCRFVGASHATAAVQAYGASSVNMLRCLGTGSAKMRFGNGSGGIVNGAGVMNIDHCVFLNSCGSGVLQNGAGGTTTVRSSIVESGSVYAIGKTLENWAGTLVSRNNILVGRFTDNVIYGGTVDRADDITNTWPQFRVYSRKGWIVPRIDDTSNAADVVTLTSQLQSRGLRGLWVVSYDSEVYGNVSDYAEQFATVKSGGVWEIGAHAYSHSDCSLTGAAMTVTKAGAVLNVDRTANEIRIGASVVVSAFKSKTLAQIKTLLQAAGCTVSNITANLDIRCLGEALDTVVNADITSATALNLLIDATGASGYLKVEIADCKALLESALGITIHTFATPRGLTSAAVQAVAYAAGYEALSSSISAADREYSLLSMDLYRVSYIWAKDLVGANNAATRANTLRLCEWAATEGAIVHLISHQNTETSPENWGVILDAMKEHRGVKIGSMHDAMTWLQANGWVIDGRTIALTDGWTAEYDLRVDDDQRGTHAGIVVSGVNDAGQLDPWGNATPSQPNIGADQGAAKGFGPWAQFDGTMPTLSLAATAPGDLKQVQEWKKVASAKEIERY